MLRHAFSLFLLLLLAALLLSSCAEAPATEATTAPVTSAATSRGTSLAVTAAATEPAVTTSVPEVTTAPPPVTTAPPVTELPLSPLAAGYIRKSEGIVVDGVLDDAYRYSATISSRYQDPGYTSDASLIVDPREAIGMKSIFRGADLSADPDTSFTLYFLWCEEEGSPYLYVAAVIHDATPVTRSGAYMAHPNPWLNDAIELSYHLGGEAIPVIPRGEDTYPTYHNILVDAREKGVTDHRAEAPNHTAVSAQRSFYFDGIESATSRLDETTYVVEVKLPAFTEGYTGKPGPGFTRHGGDPLGEGDLVFFCVELLDLTYLPEGYDKALPTEKKYADEWSYSPLGAWAQFENSLIPYVYSGGNRNSAYLQTEGAGPAVFQLSSQWAFP